MMSLFEASNGWIEKYIEFCYAIHILIFESFNKYPYAIGLILLLVLAIVCTISSHLEQKARQTYGLGHQEAGNTIFNLGVVLFASLPVLIPLIIAGIIAMKLFTKKEAPCISL